MMTSYDMKESGKRMKAFPPKKNSTPATDIRSLAGWMAVFELVLVFLSVFLPESLGAHWVDLGFCFGGFVASGVIWLAAKGGEKM